MKELVPAVFRLTVRGLETQDFKEAYSRSSDCCFIQRLFEKAQEFYRESNLPFGNITLMGHGLGISIYEEPIISPISKHVLQENMLICMEPRVYDHDDQTKYHIENKE